MGEGKDMYEEINGLIKRREQFDHISNKRPLTLAEQKDRKEVCDRLRELKEEDDKVQGIE